MKKTPKVMIIGAVPPPYHGVTLFIKRILTSRLSRQFDFIHFDISDHRTLANIGRFDLYNIGLALFHLFKLAIMSIVKQPAVTYLPLSWNKAGFIRDALFILCLRLFSRTRIIFHLHGGYFKAFYLHHGTLFRRFIDFCIVKADAALVLSERLKRNFYPWFRDEHIFVLPNGVDVDSRYLQSKKKASRQIIISFLGNLYPEKGVFEAIKGFYYACANLEHVVFKIAGEWDLRDPSYQEEVFEFIKQHGLEDRVIFTGSLFGEDKIKFLSDTDIFLFPSWIEGMPTVVIEAMAASCPVVSTNVGAIPDLVYEGRNGYLCPSRDIDKISEKLHVLLNDPNLRKKMGIESRIIYEQHFTFEKPQKVFKKIVRRFLVTKQRI